MSVKNGTFLPCKTCQKIIYKRPCEIKANNFCSPKCNGLFHGHNISKRKRNGSDIECPVCKKSIYVCPSILKSNIHGMRFCSRKCRTESMKNGLAKWGFAKTGDHTSNNQYIRKQINKVRMKEHRRVMQEHLGRPLLKTEVVHHINENPKDNRIENLQLMTNEEHVRLHKKKNSIIFSLF